MLHDVSSGSSSRTSFTVGSLSGLGLNVKCSSFPLMLNLISPFPTSMWALAVLRNGLPMMMDTFESGFMSSTMKSTGTRKSLILTGMFSAIPTGVEPIDLLVAGTLMLVLGSYAQASSRLMPASH